MFDSIKVAFTKRPMITGGFATKTTFINGFRSPVFTARAGLDYNHTVRVGAGVSWLKLSPYDKDIDNTPFYLDQNIVDSTGTYTLHPALNLTYGNVFFEYIYFNTARWQFSVPLQVGAGNSYYKYNLNGVNRSEKQHWVLLYEPAVSGQYRVTPWFGFGLDIGLRIMVVTNKNIGTKLTSPVFDLKALIYWGNILRWVTGKKQSVS